jgi:hypothetical protein
MKIWAILAILYAAAVVVIAVLKPAQIWNMKKIQLFKKVLGDKGTEIFFYIWAFVFLVLGVWLFTKG